MFCGHCGTQAVAGARFCGSCGKKLADEAGVAPAVAVRTALPLASYGKRIGTLVLDSIIAVITLGVGYLIWFAIVAPKGQTPSMALVGVHCVDETGKTVSPGRMWVRQLIYAGLVYWIANLFIGLVFVWLGVPWLPIATLIGYVWAFWDKDRQTLHDKMAGTFVVEGS